MARVPCRCQSAAGGFLLAILLSSACDPSRQVRREPWEHTTTGYQNAHDHAQLRLRYLDELRHVYGRARDSLVIDSIVYDPDRSAALARRRADVMGSLLDGGEQESARQRLRRLVSWDWDLADSLLASLEHLLERRLERQVDQYMEAFATRLSDAGAITIFNSEANHNTVYVFGDVFESSYADFLLAGLVNPRRHATYGDDIARVVILHEFYHARTNKRPLHIGTAEATLTGEDLETANPHVLSAIHEAIAYGETMVASVGKGRTIKRSLTVQYVFAARQFAAFVLAFRKGLDARFVVDRPLTGRDQELRDATEAYIDGLLGQFAEARAYHAFLAKQLLRTEIIRQHEKQLMDFLRELSEARH